MPNLLDTIKNSIRSVNPFAAVGDKINEGMGDAQQAAAGPVPQKPAPPMAAGALMAGDKPEVIRENIATLMRLGMPEEEAMRRALELAKPKGMDMPEPMSPMAPDVAARMQSQGGM